jgi:hemolysin activation/secretion protein
MSLSLRYPTLAAALLSALTLSAHAQTSPDAGSLQQQIDSERQQQMPKRVAPEKAAAPAAMKPTAGVVLTVKQFRFAGNQLMSAEQLAPVVADYLDHPLDFAQLQGATAAVGAAYRSAGWVVNAYLPQQDIKDGIVTIHIIEAVFGKLKMGDTQPKRVAPGQVEAIFTAQQATGVSLNADNLDRALLLADDLPGITVAGSLAAGSSEGETDLILKLADEPLMVGEVSADNFGSRSTGANRFSGNVNLNSMLGIGDSLANNLIHTEGSDYLRMAYNLPAGSEGWRVGVSASSLAYKLVTVEFAALDGKGTSTAAGVDASYPVIRSRLKNLYLSFNYDNKQFDNQSSGVTQSHYQIDNFSMGLNGNVFDELGGGGANSYSFILSSGHVSLGQIDAGENTALKRNFSKLRYTLSRQQAVTDNISLFAAVVGQESDRNDFDSSEKFYLGGASGVRAYPASEGGGSTGNISNMELRWRLPEGFNITAFYDHGEIHNYDNTASYNLNGAGVSLAWQASFGLNLKATLAQRIGNNPNPTTTGNDQDGSYTNQRIWLSASQTF